MKMELDVRLDGQTTRLTFGSTGQPGNGLLNLVEPDDSIRLVFVL